MRKLVLLLVLGLGAHLSQAQAQTSPVKNRLRRRFVYHWPTSRAKAIEAEMKSTETQLKNQIDAKYADFQKKLADYNANLNTMLDAVRQNTERSLPKCSKTSKNCRRMHKPPFKQSPTN
jgi:outer membrane protein